MTKGALTDAEFWDDYWESTGQPQEIDEATAYPHQREILRVMTSFLPRGVGMKALELGAGGGVYLSYLARTLGYEPHGLDFSEAGLEALRDRFSRVGLHLHSYRRDFLDEDLTDLPSFDVVFSMGLIEHFDDYETVVERHLALLAPGGWLMLGVPNLRGINLLFVRLLRMSDDLTRHNLRAMDLSEWMRFEDRFGLRTIFKGYVGGWEPRLYMRAGATLFHRALNVCLRKLVSVLDRSHRVRRCNAWWLSGYAIAIYRRAN